MQWPRLFCIHCREKRAPSKTPTQKSKPDDATRVSLAPAGISYNVRGYTKLPPEAAICLQHGAVRGILSSPRPESARAKRECKDRAPQAKPRSAACQPLVIRCAGEQCEYARVASSDSGQSAADSEASQKETNRSLPSPMNALAPRVLHSLTGGTCPVENPNPKKQARRRDPGISCTSRHFV